MRRGTGEVARPLYARVLVVLAVSTSLALGACGGGGGSGTASSPTLQPPAGTPTQPPTPSPPTPQPITPPSSTHFTSPESVSRFLATASFGATSEDLNALVGTSASRWFLEQLEQPQSLFLPLTNEYRQAAASEAQEGFIRYIVSAVSFWRNAVEGPDQLRQRMAYALSQILVISDIGSDLIADQPQSMAYYRDILGEHAFGNFRDLLQDVTYSPAMADYLTYLGNLPADPDTGRQPDENYAREVMQLFTIGLLELNDDGTPKLDAQGQSIETYGSDDIDGLARVFTGLDVNGHNYYETPELLAQPLAVDEYRHSKREKTFLGTSIPADTPGDESIRLALDHLFAHPNVGPFLGRQLIQRFTTSSPGNDYVRRVAEAFNSGSYVLPDNTQVGEGRRGDLTATLAAVLFDADARAEAAAQSDLFGKPREPVLRFLQWARAFGVDGSAPELTPILYDTAANDSLGQQAYRSRSVFNFYRPGFVAPGTESGRQGMTVPELQIVNASTTAGYVNFLTYFIFGEPRSGESLDFLRDYLGGSSLAQNLDARARRSFVPDYTDEIALSEDPEALVDHLDALLAHGALEVNTKSAIVDLISDIPMERQDYQYEEDDGRHARTHFAVLMVMTSPEYLVQR